MTTDINEVIKIKPDNISNSNQFKNSTQPENQASEKFINEIDNNNNYDIEDFIDTNFKKNKSKEFLLDSTLSKNETIISTSNVSLNQSNLQEEILIMKTILRFLQLLCENHNTEMQNLLRIQTNNKTSYNLVCDTLQFLDCICGSTTGGLGLLGLWINENNVELINQALESLTEYCQGPCHENQFSIINHESNGIDIVIALILNDIQPLSKNNLELYLELKNNASKLLLAVMESNDDTSNAERILYNISPKNLIDAIADAYQQGKDMSKQFNENKSIKEQHENLFGNKCNQTILSPCYIKNHILKV